MQKTLLILVLAMLCLIFKADAQGLKPLKIGDTVPEVIWKLPLQVVNHHEGKETITLDNYRGKMIILDFWATWCTACIAAMPNLHALQDQFKNQLMVIPVTNDPATKAKTFLKNNRSISHLKLLSIVDDTLLRKLFPAKSIPHYVWILPDGTVKAITETHQLTADNVARILKSPAATKLVLKDAFDLKKPLMLTGDLAGSRLMQYSFFIEGNHLGLPSRAGMRIKADTIYGRYCTNFTLLNMYRFLAHELFMKNGETFNGSKQFVLEVKDPGNLDFEQSFNSASGTPKEVARQTWLEQHLCSYEVILPMHAAGQLYPTILQLLNSASGYHARIEKRKMSCWVLVKTGPIAQLISKGVRPENRGAKETPGKLTNAPVGKLTAMLNNAKISKLPVINETGIEEHIDLSLTLSSDIKQLQKQLQTYNLDLIIADRAVSMFVIGDRTHQ